MEVNNLTIDEARSAIQQGKTTAVALAESFYSNIKSRDSEIGAYLTLSNQRALQQARRIDQLVAEGKPLPPLGGVPVGIKDVLTTRGVRTTAGSKILDNFIPAYDSTAVSRLEQAGAVGLKR